MTSVSSVSYGVGVEIDDIEHGIYIMIVAFI